MTPQSSSLISRPSGIKSKYELWQVLQTRLDGGAMLRPVIAPSLWILHVIREMHVRLIVDVC